MGITTYSNIKLLISFMVWGYIVIRVKLTKMRRDKR